MSVCVVIIYSMSGMSLVLYCSESRINTVGDGKKGDI